MIMPFGWEGGTQVIVKLRGWSPDTAGVSTGPGPGGKEKEIDKEKKKSKRLIYSLCVLIKERKKRE